MKKPTLKEIADHMNNQEEAILFFSFYESKNWYVGKNKMQRWKSAATGWINRNNKKTDIQKAVSNKKTAIIDRLWVRMAQIYGHKWVSSYGTEPTKPWIDVISRMSNDQIAHGLNLILKSGDDWPVSLVKFNQFCASAKPQLKALPSMTKGQVTALRDRTARTREFELNRIRGIL